MECARVDGDLGVLRLAHLGVRAEATDHDGAVRVAALEILGRRASICTSSVIAGGASIAKWTISSEPSASRSSTCPFSRRSDGVSPAIAASSRCSGRSPTRTFLPS